jgi:carbamoyl-phosphate synthase large subunit
MINVLVTGIGGGGIGEQILKALKMSELELMIFGSDITEITKNFSEVNNFQVFESAGSNNYIPKLIEYCITNKINVIFPGSEPELIQISKNRHLFEKEKIFLPINPDHVIDICFDKNRTNIFLKQHNFPYPKSFLINKICDIERIDIFPVILKPNVGGSGSTNIMIAQNINELNVFSKYLLNIYSSFLVQEYIGTPESEYTVGVLFDMKGNLINSIALNRIITTGLGSKINIKNKTGSTDLGERLVVSSGISQGTIDKFPFITEVCVDIGKKLGAHSAINIQCRYFNNKVYVFEINPRYSGTTSLRAMVGYNEPEILLKMNFLNKKIQQNFQYRSATILRGLNETII